jgi:hypothetical protein
LALLGEIEIAPQDSRIRMNGRFDPEFCGRVCRAAATVCLALIFGTAIFVITAQSSKCPGWWIPGTGAPSTSVLGLLAITGSWGLVVTYYAVTWKRFAQRVIDRIQWSEQTFVSGTRPSWYSDWSQFNAMCAASLDFNILFVVVMIVSVLIVAVPLLMIATNCF